MFGDFLNKNITSQASYVTFGYGQVEPNHLSAQRTGQIYAQLPANKDIKVLEQGQFVKYDYAAHTDDAGIGEVNFTGAGEWMLVFNEIKLYREHQLDCEFAMVKSNYDASIYSPYDAAYDAPFTKDADGNLVNRYEKQSRYYNGVDSEGNTDTSALDGVVDENGNAYTYRDVTAGVDYYEPTYTEDPFHFEGRYKAKKMNEGTKMVPRVFKTNVGDIFTTNTINADSLAVGDTLKVGDNGILEPGTDDKMEWQVVKVYTMPDHQKGVKIMRII